MNRAQTAGGTALVLFAIVAGLWWGAGRDAVPPSVAGPPQTIVERSAASSSITVHVAGHVTDPGLVELPEGSRVADAVAAAGGLLPGARADLINLAALVVDGQQIVVFGPGGDSTSPSSGGAGAKVHLNLASAADLDALPGVGPVIADRIVSYREENGPFEAVEDLLDVPGIGEAKLADLRDHVQVP
jgi:competence protein ComEA